MFLLYTLKYSPNIYLSRAVSNTVPEPITLFFGNPDTFDTTYAIISTGLLATTNIPISGISKLLSMKLN